MATATRDPWFVCPIDGRSPTEEDERIGAGWVTLDRSFLEFCSGWLSRFRNYRCAAGHTWTPP